ncbi:MAG: lysophospholipase L1-like esterase [Halieaceae bacterium]
MHDLLISGDEMHPSDLGHALIARWLADILMAELAQP